MSETCANCKTLIGELETPYIYNDNVVCGGCNDRLRLPVVTPKQPIVTDIPQVNLQVNVPEPTTIIQPAPPVQRHVMTTQRTSKVLKFQLLLSVFIIIGGSVWFFVTYSSPDEVPQEVLIKQGVVICFGVFWFALTRFVTWWNHA